MPTETACAYVAGFVDGEGSITITEHRRADRPGYMRRNVRLTIYNTNLGILESIQSEFGGVIYVVRRPLDKWKDQFSLVWSEASIVPVLEAIFPYLRLKLEQARIALAYQKMKLPANAGRKHGHPTASIVEMNALSNKMRLLNKRGKDAGSQ